MKKTILISLLSGISYISQAQCNFTPPCNNPVTGSYLTNQSFNGDQCFQGPMTISTSVNWNNIYNWTFNNVLNYQTINLPYGGNIYTNGYTTLNQVNFTGNGHLYVQGGETHLFSTTSNNSNQGSFNTVTLSDSALFFYNGIQYQVGDTIQLSGNASNRIYVLDCSNIPLGFSILFYEIGYDFLDWKVDPVNFKEVEIMYSSDDPYVQNPDTYTWTKIDSSKNLIDTYHVKKVGIYRIKVGNDYSFMCNFNFLKGNNNLPLQNEPLKKVELYEIKSLGLKAWKTIK